MPFHTTVRVAVARLLDAAVVVLVALPLPLPLPSSLSPASFRCSV